MCINLKDESLEYHKQYYKLFDKYQETQTDEDRNALIDAQYAFMENFLSKLDQDSKVYELFSELTYHSATGQATVLFDTEEEANEFDIMIWENYSDMALDSQVYEFDRGWIVDYMFGGMYCPAWDGIDKE